MPRAKSVYVCMICDRVPCECNKKPETKRAPRPRREKPVVDVESPLTTTPPPAPVAAPRVDIKGAMKARASDTAVVTSPRAATDAAWETDLRNAVIALWPILAPEEREKYAAQFAPKSRVQSWRERVYGNA